MTKESENSCMIFFDTDKKIPNEEKTPLAEKISNMFQKNRSQVEKITLTFTPSGKNNFLFLSWNPEEGSFLSPEAVKTYIEDIFKDFFKNNG
jgi:hypothetical protein